MRIVSLQLDDWHGTADVGEDIDDPDCEELLGAIRALDGCRRTLVSVLLEGDIQIFVGGGNAGALVITMTSSTEQHFQLYETSKIKNQGKRIAQLVVGGQLSDFDEASLINSTDAISFFSTQCQSTALTDLAGFEWRRC